MLLSFNNGSYGQRSLDNNSTEQPGKGMQKLLDEQTFGNLSDRTCRTSDMHACSFPLAATHAQSNFATAAVNQKLTKVTHTARVRSTEPGRYGVGTLWSQVRLNPQGQVSKVNILYEPTDSLFLSLLTEDTVIDATNTKVSTKHKRRVRVFLAPRAKSLGASQQTCHRNIARGVDLISTSRSLITCTVHNIAAPATPSSKPAAAASPRSKCVRINFLVMYDVNPLLF